MSYIPRQLITLSDEDKDTITVDVEPSYPAPDKRLFFSTSDAGVFLDVEQIRELRKVMTKWLIDNGHKKPKSWA